MAASRREFASSLFGLGSVFQQPAVLSRGASVALFNVREEGAAADGAQIGPER
jgi:hypothetical protein